MSENSAKASSSAGSALKCEVLRRIGNIARAIATDNDARFKRIGFQRGQHVFVTRVCEQPGITQVQLSHLLRVDKSTTTKSIQKLEAAGYIERRRGEDDRRSWCLYPTERAQRIYKGIIERENLQISCALEGMGENERDEFMRLLAVVEKNCECFS